MLIAAGADIDKRLVKVAHPGGTTALILAASHGKVAFVRMLVAAGAKIDCLDNDGISALKAAVMNGMESCVEVLTSLTKSNPRKGACAYCGSKKKLSVCSGQGFLLRNTFMCSTYGGLTLN